LRSWLFLSCYRRFLGILGAGSDPAGSPECESYVKLRESLAKGGLPARLYARRLTGFLNGADSFFGDAGMANHTLFPHAFGLKTPAPLWTPHAFDRCLFLALVYPIATIFIIWAVSGHAGPAEMALGLKPNVSGWSRSFIAAAAAFEGFAIWSMFGRNAGNQSSGSMLPPLLALTRPPEPMRLSPWPSQARPPLPSRLIPSAQAQSLLALPLSARSLVRAGLPGAISVAATIPVAFGLAFGLGGASSSTVARAVGAAAAVSIGTLLLAAFAINRQAQGQFLLFFIPAMIAACLSAVGLLLPLQTWPYTGPLRLFQVLLTLINAPFNWVSIGLTRALLRRGLELGGWWPYFLGVANAVLATAIVAALTLTMVIAVQAFDEPNSASRRHLEKSGGTGILVDLRAFACNHDPEPTQSHDRRRIADFGNAGLAKPDPPVHARGQSSPRFRSNLARDHADAAYFFRRHPRHRRRGLSRVGLAIYVMPSAGLNLLDQARAVAAFDVPARVGRLFASFR
jgi:hypothetical protein